MEVTMNKVFLAVISAICILATFIETSNVKAEEPKIDIISELDSVEDAHSGNIREIESKKFRNLTEATKTLTVYEVYGHKILVVENNDKGSLSILKLE